MGIIPERQTSAANNKIKFCVAAVVITAISFIDYQFFARWPGAISINYLAKGTAHLAALTAIMLAGGYVFGFGSRSISGALWQYAYASITLLMVLSGVGYYMLKLLPYSFIKCTGFLRPVFCSPLPLFIMYILNKAVQNPAASRNAGTE